MSKYKTEHGIQNAIRNALADRIPVFRANVGAAWTGNEIRKVRTKCTVPVFGGDPVTLDPGDVVIRKPRPFDTGLPAGFSDLFGVLPVTITPDMVGQTLGVAVFGEVKTDTGRASEKQAGFLQAMLKRGARVGVWRSVQDALDTIKT